MEIPAFAGKDGDSVITWNLRKLKGKRPPGTWDPKHTRHRSMVFYIFRKSSTR